MKLIGKDSQIELPENENGTNFRQLKWKVNEKIIAYMKPSIVVETYPLVDAKNNLTDKAKECFNNMFMDYANEEGVWTKVETAKFTADVLNSGPIDPDDGRVQNVFNKYNIDSKTGHLVAQNMVDFYHDACKVREDTVRENLSCIFIG